MSAARLRIAATVVSVAVIGGALAGCSQTHQPVTPAAVTSSTAPTTTAGTASGTDDSSLSSIQDDLNAAQSSTANADGDVTAGDSAAATDDTH